MFDLFVFNTVDKYKTEVWTKLDQISPTLTTKH